MTFETSREIPAEPAKVFAAFSDPERLARWWGPAGFTNAFGPCEFRAGGRWAYVMRGPDGKEYPNESVFEEAGPQRVVIRHVSAPRYRLVIGLTAKGKGTLVSWAQTFDKPETARAIAHIVTPANEQNLDRLAAEVAGRTA